MAIYAFDGTMNKDYDEDGMDSNVLKFFNAYKDGVQDAAARDRCFYVSGVGTRLGYLGKFFGSVFGAGGQQRIEEGMEQLQMNVDAGDEIIDIIGFSRGSALALEFANTVYDEGVERNGSRVKPEIRFIGIWDTVASFGLPGNNVNLGYNLHVPPNADRTYHAIALDERRQSFPVTHVIADALDGRNDRHVFEVWFRGFHSDVGGGNNNEGLSSIALDWMFRRAADCGIEIPANHVAKNRNLMNPDADREKPGMDLIANRKRAIRPHDVVHHSVTARIGGGQWPYNNPPKGLKVVGDDGAILAQGFGE